MIDTNYAPVCGIYCGNCDALGKQCKGCGYVNGKPFWAVRIPSGVCQFHDCCRNQKGLEHCGLCEDFPCRTFQEARDPAMSDEETQNLLKERQEALQRRTEIGTEEWLLEMSNS